jgi:hypothetical protein
MCPLWRKDIRSLLDLSELHQCLSFSCCFCALFFAIINLTYEYNLQLSLVSPCKSLNEILLCINNQKFRANEQGHVESLRGGKTQ